MKLFKVLICDEIDEMKSRYGFWLGCVVLFGLSELFADTSRSRQQVKEQPVKSKIKSSEQESLEKASSDYFVITFPDGKKRVVSRLARNRAMQKVSNSRGEVGAKEMGELEERAKKVLIAEETLHHMAETRNLQARFTDEETEQLKIGRQEVLGDIFIGVLRREALDALTQADISKALQEYEAGVSRAGGKIYSTRFAIFINQSDAERAVKSLSGMGVTFESVLKSSEQLAAAEDLTKTVGLLVDQDGILQLGGSFAQNGYVDFYLASSFINAPLFWNPVVSAITETKGQNTGPVEVNLGGRKYYLVIQVSDVQQYRLFRTPENMQWFTFGLADAKVREQIADAGKTVEISKA